MAEKTKGKKRPSKRAAVLAVWERVVENRDTPVDEFIRGVLFVERNSPQWHRKKRRNSEELSREKVLEIERAARFSTPVKGKQ